MRGQNGVKNQKVVIFLPRPLGVSLLLHEGAPTLIGRFIADGSVDELFLTVAFQVAGRNAGAAIAQTIRPSRTKAIDRWQFHQLERTVELPGLIAFYQRTETPRGRPIIGVPPLLSGCTNSHLKRESHQPLLAPSYGACRVEPGGAS